MNQKFICAGIVALALASPIAANAQGVPGLLPPYEVLTMVRSTGLDPLGQPARRGSTYVLRAIDQGGEEVRVVVDARRGEIISVVPVVPARLARPAERDGDTYERISPPGGLYLPPDAYRSGPPPIHEAEPPVIYGNRPPPPPASVPPRYSANPPNVIPAPSSPADLSAPSTPQILAPEVGENGQLPPPPERFPQRAAPAPEPKAKPAPRRSASAAPANPPLPKPRPAQPMQVAPNADASPLLPPIPERKPADPVPH